MSSRLWVPITDLGRSPINIQRIDKWLNSHMNVVWYSQNLRTILRHDIVIGIQRLKLLSILKFG